MIYPEPTAKRELITKREKITKRERVRGLFWINNIVIWKMINNNDGNKVEECKKKAVLGETGEQSRARAENS